MRRIKAPTSANTAARRISALFSFLQFASGISIPTRTTPPQKAGAGGPYARAQPLAQRRRCRRIWRGSQAPTRQSTRQFPVPRPASSSLRRSEKALRATRNHAGQGGRNILQNSREGVTHLVRVESIGLPISKDIRWPVSQVRQHSWRALQEGTLANLFSFFQFFR